MTCRCTLVNHSNPCMVAWALCSCERFSPARRCWVPWPCAPAGPSPGAAGGTGGPAASPARPDNGTGTHDTTRQYHGTRYTRCAGQQRPLAMAQTSFKHAHISYRQQILVVWDSILLKTARPRPSLVDTFPTTDLPSSPPPPPVSSSQCLGCPVSSR